MRKNRQLFFWFMFNLFQIEYRKCFLDYWLKNLLWQIACCNLHLNRQIAIILKRVKAFIQRLQFFLRLIFFIRLTRNMLSWQNDLFINVFNDFIPVFLTNKLILFNKNVRTSLPLFLLSIRQFQLLQGLLPFFSYSFLNRLFVFKIKL